MVEGDEAEMSAITAGQEDKQKVAKQFLHLQNTLLIICGIEILLNIWWNKNVLE